VPPLSPSSLPKAKEYVLVYYLEVQPDIDGFVA
jgi:hypothetical protein